MKLLHTSDWHLGVTLASQSRYDELKQFLNWLVQTIKDHNIDALLVAGDVFDTGTPSAQAQKLYYQFLGNVARSTQCRHIAIVAGNHDSPSFLNAPKELLEMFEIHVVGSAPERIEDEVIILSDIEGKPECIVCAVPYLRDRDLRTVEAGESVDDKTQKLLEGLKQHYTHVCEVAQQKQSEILAESGVTLPIVAMGHLYTAGGQLSEDNEKHERKLVIGNLAGVKRDIFPDSIDYLALGHLHVPQRVNKQDAMQYSGSPIPMSFDEAKQTKRVVVVEFENGARTISHIEIPCFQKLVIVRADSEDVIREKLNALTHSDPSAWVWVDYTGNAIVADLKSVVETAITGSDIKVLRCSDSHIKSGALIALGDEKLEDLSVDDVFERKLDSAKIPDEQRVELRSLYAEILQSIHESE